MMEWLLVLVWTCRTIITIQEHQNISKSIERVIKHRKESRYCIMDSMITRFLINIMHMVRIQVLLILSNQFYMTKSRMELINWSMISKKDNIILKKQNHWAKPLIDIIIGQNRLNRIINFSLEWPLSKMNSVLKK